MDYFSEFETVFKEVPGGKFEAVMEVEPVSEKWFNNGFNAMPMVSIDSGAACAKDKNGQIMAYIGSGDDCHELANLVESGEGVITWRKLTNETVMVEVLVLENTVYGSGDDDFGFDLF